MADIVRPERPVGADLTELADLSGAELVGGNRAVLGATLRAQDAAAGDLFAALPGSRVHGAQFAAEAIAGGAVAVLTDAAGLGLLRADPATDSVPVLVHDDPRAVLGPIAARVYGDPSSGLTLVGITGTSGKTTTAYLTEAALRAAGRVVGLVGTVEIRIDGQRVPSSLTTPEAPDLQRLLAVMRERGVDTVVMEVSSHALSLGRVDGSRFAVGGFTNLSQDHLDFHPTMDDYFAAKARLFEGESPVRAASAVICVDDVRGEQMAMIARSSTEQIATVSTSGDADWCVAAEVETSEAGSQTVVVRTPGGAEHVMVVPLPGAYNVANALVAVALAAAAGAPVDVAVGGLALVAVPGRLEKVDRGQDFLALVDYAHKPAAVEAVLATLSGQTDGRVAVVLGAGGDRDTEKRPLMGAAAARGADLVVVTDDNPRSEDPAAIRAAVRSGADAVAPAQRRADEILEIGDRAQAIAAAVRWAEPGDVVLVAGKGHETGQEIDGHKHPFDDREVLAAALAERAVARLADDGAAEPVGPGADRVLTVLTADEPATVDTARRLLRSAVAQAADLGIGSAHRTPGSDPSEGRRTWAMFGELASTDAADENARCIEHDLLGRQAVRLAVDRTLAVGGTRVIRALYQGAIQEGSWGDEAAFYPAVDDLVAVLAEAAGTADAPRAGDLVLVAGGSGLTAALLDLWSADAALDAVVRTL